MDWTWPHFTPGELACKGDGALKFHPGFMEALEALRVAFGRAMTVTGCCRTKAYNIQINGHPRSLHICDEPQHPGQQGTLAADIAVASVVDARELGLLAMTLGWSVGVPKAGFIHLDRRDLIGLPRGLFGY
jgi:hypothetical protein